MIREKFIQHIMDLQDQICHGLEEVDAKMRFREDLWERPGGGGGRTRVLAGGNVFEKAGVNTSVVEGEVTPVMRSQLQLSGDRFFATGISLVLHPLNPFVPTVHANYRYFEISENGKLTDSWFGGGADLTPYYLFKEDAIHFHQVHKNACDDFGADLYPLFKRQCDEYFVNTHRNNEARGIGGIFFDHVRADKDRSMEEWFKFAVAAGNAFLPAYLPIVRWRMNSPYDESHRYWQEIRRGRYVEFNLVHDRGTLFGLRTNGRTESILMSLPPRVRFDYDYSPAPDSPEDELWQVVKQPVNWV